MSNLKHGDQLLCKGHSIISKTIMTVTKSEWSHAAIYLEINGQPYIIEAQKNGVNLKTFEEWRTNWNYEYIVYRNKFSFDEQEFLLKALSKSGETSYDFHSFLLRQPWKLLTGKWKDKGKKENDKMICSEFCAWVWGIPEYWKLTPQDLFVYLKNSKSWLNILQD